MGNIFKKEKKEDNIKYTGIFEQYKQKLNHKDKACITSFSILRNKRIMLTFKEGKVKIFKLDTSNDNIELKEIIIMELDEYCFNYGIELKNGNIALCSEDSTLNIIKLKCDEDNKQNEENAIILPYSDKYELIHKVLIKDRTFSLIELSIGEIISSQCYSKTLIIFNIYECETKIINNIESNENPNIICKYNDENEIVFVAHDKGINIVSVINKCLIKNILIKDNVSCLCPLNIFTNTKDEKEIFTLLVGTKKRVFGKKVNYIYNIIQIGFNFFNKDKKGKIIYDTEKEDKIEISGQEEVHLNEIKQINAIERNIIFGDKDKDKAQKKENKIIISMGSEDRRLIFWEMNNLSKK